MECLLENLFVDDISFFSNSIDELLTLQDSAVKAFNIISMPLSKYVSKDQFHRDWYIEKTDRFQKKMDVTSSESSDWVNTKPCFPLIPIGEGDTQFSFLGFKTI